GRGGGDAYEYPIRPGSAVWKTLQSHDDMVRVTQVEESLLASMSDEGLVRTVLSYPLLGDVLAYNSPQQGFDAIRSQFGGLRELLGREGAAELLLRRYQQTDAADVPAVLSLEEQGRRTRDLFHVEILLAQPEILAGMNDELLDELLLETLVKREQKLERLEVYGFAGLESTAFTAVRALERAQPGPATRNKVSQKMNAFLETGGPATIEVLDSIFARTEKVVLGSSYRALSKRSGATSKDYTSTVSTPKGTAVPVWVMTYELSSADIAACNSNAVATYPNATRLRDCSRMYNCHSYAWHNQSLPNNVWINTPGDDKYWQDGSYVSAAITGGQKVSYASDDHSAIAISASVYESKWGQWPLMRHAPCYTPYDCSVLNGYQLAPPPTPGIAVSIQRNNTGGGDPELIYTPNYSWETSYVDFYNEFDYTSLSGVTFDWRISWDGGAEQPLSSDPSVTMGFTCLMANHSVELILTISAPGWQTGSSRKSWNIVGYGCY
ncbi:MAG TPA: hypothetical protein VIW92_15580, partial [Thermoanaerobaculia bacterium]